MNFDTLIDTRQASHTESAESRDAWEIPPVHAHSAGLNARAFSFWLFFFIYPRYSPYTLLLLVC